ncbi:hypothetical protein [Nonomuraea recticatena]|uniref:hypothetical protein n=1 Tax=Nonomuraea recticatena TaxID=46178 RepID=UPI0036073ACA
MDAFSPEEDSASALPGGLAQPGAIARASASGFVKSCLPILPYAVNSLYTSTALPFLTTTARSAPPRLCFETFWALKVKASSPSFPAGAVLTASRFVAHDAAPVLNPLMTCCAAAGLGMMTTCSA